MKKITIIAFALLFMLGFSGLSLAVQAASIEVFLDDPDVAGVSYEMSMAKTVGIDESFTLDLWIYDPDDNTPFFEEPDDYLFVAWGSAAETNRLLDYSLLNVISATGTEGTTWDVANPTKREDTYPSNVIANHWGIACEQPDPGSVPLDGYFQLGTFHFGASKDLGTASYDIVEYNNDPDNFQTWEYVNLDPDGGVVNGVNFNQGSITVVPIPSALLLLGSGLMGLVGLTRKMQT